MSAEAEPNVIVESPLWNAATVGQYLGGVTPETVRRLATTGELAPPVKIGRLHFWRRDDVEAFVRGEQVGTRRHLTANAGNLERIVARVEVLEAEIRELRARLYNAPASGDDGWKRQSAVTGDDEADAVAGRLRSLVESHKAGTPWPDEAMELAMALLDVHGFSQNEVETLAGVSASTLQNWRRKVS